MDKLAVNKLRELIDVAAGRKRAEVVLKNAEVVNTLTEEIERKDIAIHRGVIAGVGEYRGIKEIDCSGLYAVPGLIDAHTHIEMSMLTVTEFAKLIVPRGTTCVIADPHEIANVLGVDGVKLMLEEAKHTPLKVYCMIPSCVPSSHLETSGGEIGYGDVEKLLGYENVLGLAEVMNFPGVVEGDEDVLAKIVAAKGYKIDGHFPSSKRYWMNAYVVAGIMSDHENVNAEDARAKLRLGMRVMVREGSAAKNLGALKEVVKEANRYVMLVTDGDRTVSDILREGYLDYVFRRAVEEGVDAVKALQMLTLNPSEYYGLNLGLIAPGRIADIVLLKKLESFDVKGVFVNGGKPEFGKYEYPSFAKNTVKVEKVTAEKLGFGRISGKVRVIEVMEREIVTGESIEEIESEEELVERGINRAVVVERHRGSGRIGKALVRGFNLKRGAIAQTIAHDAHNIVAVGVGEAEICEAINAVVEMQGGIAVFDGGKVETLQLRIAGLMSDDDAEKVAERLEMLHEAARKIGCRLKSPFVTLSFIALPVIPKLKVTDLGLVDVEKFEVVDIVVEK